MRPLKLAPHRKKIVAQFMAGASMNKLGRAYNSSDSAIRFCLKTWIPKTYERIQDKRWGSKRVKHRQVTEKSVQVGVREQCICLDTCNCSRCTKRRQDPPTEQERMNAYKAYPDGMVGLS
jgi:hypothetical protein